MTQRFHHILVEIAKLQDYCLNEAHPRGRHKAQVFRSRLGLSVNDDDVLRRALFDAARDRQDDLRQGDADAYGHRFVLDFEMTAGGSTATVQSAWIVLHGEDVLRFISCYVL
jgi:hypothetical protein